MVTVLLSTSVERCFVSRMWNFFFFVVAVVTFQGVLCVWTVLTQLTDYIGPFLSFHSFTNVLVSCVLFDKLECNKICLLTTRGGGVIQLGFCMARGRGWLGSSLILDHMGEGRSEPLFFGWHHIWTAPTRSKNYNGHSQMTV